MLTGRYASRSKVLQQEYPPGGPVAVWGFDALIGDDEFSLPKLLRKSGYVTGMVGDWSFGGHPAKLRTFDLSPEDDASNPQVDQLKACQSALKKLVRSQGFDFVESIYPMDLRQTLPEAVQNYNMEWVTQGALDFIRRNRDRPFFLYMAPPLPNGPGELIHVNSLKSDPRITAAGRVEVPLHRSSLRGRESWNDRAATRELP